MRKNPWKSHQKVLLKNKLIAKILTQKFREYKTTMLILLSYVVW